MAADATIFVSRPVAREVQCQSTCLNVIASPVTAVAPRTRSGRPAQMVEEKGQRIGEFVAGRGQIQPRQLQP